MKRRMTQPKDMTYGSPGKLIFTFALPLIAGNIFQELYTIVDTIIVGQTLGVNTLAAVGATGWVFMFHLMLIQGFTQGFGIQIAKRIGENDIYRIKQSLRTALVLSSILAVILLIGMQLIVEPSIRILRIPFEISDLSRTYLRVVFLGIPMTVAYNIFAVILRSFGNSKAPLNAMIISTVSNVVLDLLFIVIFQWGVVGSALGTVLSQLFSAIYCFLKIQKLSVIRTKTKDVHIDSKDISIMLKLGLPMSAQNMIITVGGVVLQAFVDSYGVVFMAGYIATTKLYGIIQCAGIAYGFAVVTYTGQNFGAKKFSRIRQGLKSGLIIAIISCLVIAVLMFIFGKFILSLFISGNPQDTQTAMNYAYEFLCIMSASLPVLYILFVIRSVLQGLGHTMVSMVSGIFEMIVRIGGSVLLPLLLNERGLFVTEVLAWLAADIILIIGYFIYIKKDEAAAVDKPLIKT